jgi:hypothetical protein
MRIKPNLDFSASGDFTANGNATAPRSPLTAKGMAKYAGILSINEIDEIVVSGTLPKGNTTEMPLKVARAASGYETGTFAPNGDFKPSELLSFNSPSNDQRPLGPSGRVA